MKRLVPLLLLAPALAWSCSDDSGDGDGGGSGGMGGANMAGNGGSSGSGMAGSGMAGSGMAGSGMAGSGMAGSGMDGQLSFATDIHPFLVAKCAGSDCHSAGSFSSEHASDDIDDAYAATQANSVVTGEPRHEYMVTRTSGDDPDLVMPPSYDDPGCDGPPGSSAGCLTVEEFEMLEAWSEQGAPP